MTDAPFTETHREMLEWVTLGKTGHEPPLVIAFRAALAEIDRLTAENEKLKGELRRNATTSRRIR